MPGGDGTGPAGMGPMTGGAFGYCAGYPVPGYMNPVRNSISYGVNPIPGRGGFGYGRGWGRGRGRGRGWGMARGFGGYGAAYPYAYGAPYNPTAYGGYPYAPDLTPKQEADMLRDQAKAMQDEIKAINDRISELQSAAKKTK